jgi:septal ring factor EnvC (AmiA/AmiB activator)
MLCFPRVPAKKKKNGGESLSTKILVQIRDEMRGMRAGLEEVRAEIAATNERLERLEQRQTEDSIRLATEVVAVAKAVGDVRDLLRHLASERFDDHERRIAALEQKTG